jgi:hypothetical protein
MKHLAAYLLLQTGGNASPSASDIKELLSTVGIDAEEEKLTKLISELEGKDINEVSQGGSGCRESGQQRYEVEGLVSFSELLRTHRIAAQELFTLNPFENIITY